VIRSRSRAVDLGYSPDGSRLAAAGAAAISIWDLSNGAEIATLKNRSGAFTGFAFSPDGKFLATATTDWPILVWDLAAQQVKAALNGHTAPVNSVAYSADNRFLVSASDDGTARIWDAGNGREIAALAGHTGSVLKAVFSPDAKLAATAGADGIVQLWDVAVHRKVATLSDDAGAVRVMAFSPDGRYLVSVAGQRHGHVDPARSQGPLRLWNVAQHRLLFHFGAAGSVVLNVAYSCDGRTLASSDAEAVTLWDAATGELRGRMEFRDAGSVGRLGFSPNGLTLAAASEHAIVFWTAAPFASALKGSTLTAR
jgi:WD40 repeat protein